MTIIIDLTRTSRPAAVYAAVVYACWHFVGLVVSQYASKTSIQGVVTRVVGRMEEGAYTHRSSPIVVKVCIEPNELILAGLQLFSCSCLRLSMSSFCSCILHGDFVHQLPKEAVLQNSAQAFQKALTDDSGSSSNQLSS